MLLIALKSGYMAFMVCNFCFSRDSIRRSLLSSACVSHVHLYFTSRVMKASVFHEIQTPDSAFRWGLSGRREGEQDKHRVVHLGVLVVCSSGAELAPKSLWKALCLEKD